VAYYNAKTREWKDGNTAATGTRAFGSYFDDEFDQLYANWNEFFTSDGLEFSVPTADIDTVKTDEITGTDGGDVNLASIKHLIREFTVAAGESVTAGQVVEYINGEIRGGVGGNLEYASEYDFETILNIGEMTSSLISENKVFIVYSSSSYAMTAIIATISGTSISFGDPVVITSNILNPYNDISCCILEENKVFVAYRDVDSSYYGTGIVATISGTVPTFGSPVVFESGVTQFISCCRVSENKVFIAYEDEDNSDYGTSVVGTISGTVPSFGSPVVFESGTTSHTACCLVSENKVFVIANATSGAGKSWIATISGDVPGFSLSDTIGITSPSYLCCSLLEKNKVFVAYSDGGSSSHGTAIVCAIDSDDNMDYGSPIVFESATTTYISCCAIAKDKALVTYRDEGNSNYGTAVVGTIDGTVLTFGDPIVYTGTNVVLYSSAIQLEENKICVSFSDITNSDGTSLILSETELLGISQEAASAGEVARIVMDGVSTAHTGLIDGMSYYADSDGNLLDPLLKIPGTYIGQALSSTELRLKYKKKPG
jgi:hypothetical protein